MAREAKNPVKSVATTFSILDGLMELEGAGVTELADHLGLSKRTVHNYLSTLEQEEYVVSAGGTYDVGVRFLALGTYGRSRQPVYPFARPVLEDRLATVHERGYAIDDEERLAGLRCVAASILTDETVLGAISVSAPTNRLRGDRFHESIPATVQEAANVVELNVTHS